MRTISHISFQSNFYCIVTFGDDTVKSVDLNKFAKREVFHFLNDKNHISLVKNKIYYIEWEIYEADLSADTLWHIGR